MARGAGLRKACRKPPVEKQFTPGAIPPPVSGLSCGSSGCGANGTIVKLVDLTVRPAGHEETRTNKQVGRDQREGNQTFKENHTPLSNAEFYAGNLKLRLRSGIF